jgi:hypothetical protein
MVALSDLVNCPISDEDLTELSLFDLNVVLMAVKEELEGREED